MVAGIALLAGCGGGDTPAKDAATKDAPAKDATPVTPKVDTPETIKADIMANMKTMTAIMEGITDETSAKAAIPKIQEVRANMRAVAARARKVKATDAEMKMQPTKEEMAIVQKLQESQQKVAGKQGLMEILAPALEGIENDM